jgi:hypothetical protein
VDQLDPSQIADALLEDVGAKLPSQKAEIKILPARGLDLHHDVVLISDRAPVYIGTIGPKHGVWRVVKTAPNVGRTMRTQLHWHMPTKEECAIRMAEVMRPYWKPIIERHGFMGMFEDEVDPKEVAGSVTVTYRLGYIYYFDGDENDERYQKIGDYPSLSAAYNAAIAGNYISHYATFIEVFYGDHAEGKTLAREFIVTQDGDVVDTDTNEPVEVVESTKAEIDDEAKKAKKPASDDQAEAGNYQKGHVSVQGLEIAIENAKGSTRSGVNKAGEAWKVTMPAHYGYIKGTVGKDKDHLDVYIGDHPGGMLAFVVNQKKEEGGFDEHKIMLGFESKDEAVAAYDRAFTGDLGPKLRESVVSTTVDKLKDWLKSGNTKKPFEALAESLVNALLEDDEIDPKEFAKSIPREPRVYGDLKPGMVTYDETGAYSRVEEIVNGYGRNYQDESGKLVYDSGPARIVRLSQFSPAYAYGRFVQKELYHAKAALLGTEVVRVKDNSDDALWALVDAETDAREGPGTATAAREAHLERERQPEAQERARARAEIQRMMGGNR